ncbi:MAG: RNA methyltransferase [Ectothiorhodospiraceae bacterium]|nr:RNA methyltransferase [Ectothiorhodospiraceae bacterium]
MKLERIRIVLVEPQLAANIGAVARAMKTMGLGELHLVRPQQWPHPDAATMASGADDVLQHAQVHAGLEDALAGAALVVGLSARTRNLSAPAESPPQAAARVVDEASRHPVAVLFGRERTGLTNEEVDRCHRVVHIPANPDFSSLNLAAAVQVMCYELRQAALQGAPVPQPASEWPPATAEQMEQLYQHLEQTLVRIEFLRQENPRVLMRRLRLLFNRARPDRNEYQILRGILAHVNMGMEGRLPGQRGGTGERLGGREG